jgi:Abnormal spindle-like microcephaly-assoc'd, ASPM-SPD-2-Hydin
MLLLPQRNHRAFLRLTFCMTALCVLPALASAENQPVRTPSSHAPRTQLTAVTTKLELGEVAVGHISGQLITIANGGRTQLVVLSAASIGTEFGITGLDLPLTLAAGESFTFHVTFTPQRSGVACGTISIVSGAPEQTLTIQVAGTGRATGQLQVTPTASDFTHVNSYNIFIQ